MKARTYKIFKEPNKPIAGFAHVYKNGDVFVIIRFVGEEPDAEYVPMSEVKAYQKREELERNVCIAFCDALNKEGKQAYYLEPWVHYAKTFADAYVPKIYYDGEWDDNEQYSYPCPNNHECAKCKCLEDENGEYDDYAECFYDEPETGWGSVREALWNILEDMNDKPYSEDDIYDLSFYRMDFI